MTGNGEMSQCSATPSPLRFVLRSGDKLSQISMHIEWTDEYGQRQKWSSWEDTLCGCYGATKLLPANTTDICVSFCCQPGGKAVNKVDRHRRSAWVRGEIELIRLRSNGRFSEQPGIDAWFEIRGPMLRCYVCRAWNARQGVEHEAWEAWSPDFFASGRRVPLSAPTTLQLADEAAPRPRPSAAVATADAACRVTACGSCGGDAGSDELLASAKELSAATVRLRIAAEALLVVRRRTLVELKELDKQLTKQWYGVNSTQTVAAGMAVVSLAALVTMPPVGIALGVGSAATGAGATAGDAVSDRFKGNRLAIAVLEDLYEQLGFETVESEWRATFATVTATALAVTSRAEGRSRAIGSTLAVSTQMASVAVRGSVRASHLAAATRVGGQSTALAGQVLGGLGAGLAVGVAIYGWSRLKPNQTMVREKLKEVESSVEYLSSLAREVAGVIRCPICGKSLAFADPNVAIRRCQRFHCFHEACLPPSECSRSRGGECPLCPSMASSEFQKLDNPAARLGALLWRSGVRHQVTTTLQSIRPDILARGMGVVRSLATRGIPARRKSSVQTASPERAACRSGCVAIGDCTSQPHSQHHLSSEQLIEDADTHESWHAAVEAAGSLDKIDKETLEALLTEGTGMPLVFRHALWPRWLDIQRRREEAKTCGSDFETLASTEIPLEVTQDIQADLHRTRQDFVTEAGRPNLKRVLVALSAFHPSVGYAQGMNQLAGVMLKLGFDPEDTFWMLVAIMEDIIPGCHARDLHGLYRDTAVTAVLLQTFLPSHARALDGAEIELMWITTDYFLTLGAKDAPLSLIVRLWDLCFLNGPAAIFCGLLTKLDLFLPVPAAGESVDAEALMTVYKEAGRMACRGDPEAISTRLLEFLRERNGGVTAELVAGLRTTLGQRSVSFESLAEPVVARSRQLASTLRGQALENEELSVPLTSTCFWDVSGTEEEQDRDICEALASGGAIQPGDEAQLSCDRGNIDGKLLEDPLGLRHVLWPEWLHARDHQSRALAKGMDFERCASADLPECLFSAIDITIGSIGCKSDFASRLSELRRVLVAVCGYVSPTGHIRAGALLAVVLFRLRFEEETIFWMVVAALERLFPASAPDNHGLARDIATADALLQTFLPTQSEALDASGEEFVQIASDFFETLGALETPLPLVVCFWDFCFLHGSHALFCGLLAQLELFLPVHEDNDGALVEDKHRQSNVTSQPSHMAGSCTVAHTLRERFQQARRHANPAAFRSTLQGFLNDRYGGGVSAELVTMLRSAFSLNPSAATQQPQPL
eukprot:TRINITY_DN41759_c0_g1_i1.p1 TRINITY_DN41759_c0_g1~~TRINITY_DN41759_c0_g1_i1.p1  ORF type:complete len:1283 (+),score=164.96 TRINITY_DN41759_c0_g1_i1:113-3961(+)